MLLLCVVHALMMMNDMGAIFTTCASGSPLSDVLFPLNLKLLVFFLIIAFADVFCYRTALDKNLINFCRYPLDPEDGASRASLYERHAKSGPNQNIISERSISPDLVRENRDAKQKTTLFLKPPY